TEEPKKMRKLQYLLESKELPAKLVKRLFNDWAVTLRVHPWALGVHTQDGGNVSVPQGIKITCNVATNVFRSMR
ncbi:MAG: hypothetical protein Q9191_007206, partial [Dirinaria sp. TL-2023a]